MFGLETLFLFQAILTAESGDIDRLKESFDSLEGSANNFVRLDVGDSCVSECYLVEMRFKYSGNTTAQGQSP